MQQMVQQIIQQICKKMLTHIHGDDIFSLKAVFIRNKNTGFVMGYSINNTAFEITNVVKLEKDTILWSITDG